MLLSWSNQLARLLDRSRDASQVRDRRRIVHAVKHLRHADLVGPANLSASKVARGQRGLQTDIHDRGLDDLVDVVDVDDVRPVSRGLPRSAVNLLGQCGLHVFHHAVVVGLAKEIRQKESRDVHAFVRIRIAVIDGDAFGGGPQRLACHVRQETRLFVVHLFSADVREQLLRENVRDVVGLVGLGRPRMRVLTDPRQCLLVRLNRPRLHDRLRHHRVIRGLVLTAQNEFADLSVRQDAQRAKEDDNRDLRFDARDRHTNHRQQLILGMIHDLDGVGLGHLVIVGTDALDLHDLQFFHASTAVAKDKGAIFRHALHGDHRALSTLNNEVASHVFGTLAHRGGRDMLLVVEKTVFGPHHHGDFSQVNMGKDTDVGFADAVAGMINEDRRHFHVHVERGGIRQIAKAGIIGHHRMNGTVVLEDRRLTNGDLFEFQRHFVFMLNRSSSHRAVGRGAHQSMGSRRGESCRRRQRRTRSRQGNFR